jgi:hypothetical protein
MESETNVKPGKTNRKNKATFGLQAFRSPDGEYLAHDEAQVTGHRGNQVSLLNLLDPAKPTPPRSARVAYMGEAALHPLAPQALQTLALSTPRAASIV